MSNLNCEMLWITFDQKIELKYFLVLKTAISGMQLMFVLSNGPLPPLANLQSESQDVTSHSSLYQHQRTAVGSMPLESNVKREKQR